MIEIRQVSRVIDGTWVLRDVSLEVASGEALAVIGPSGSGKTTLLRLIAGLDVPSSGHIVLAGRIASGNGTFLPPHQRGVGMVFQRPSLWPHMTVAQNVGFGLARMSSRESARRLQEVIELTALAGLEKRYPHQLSGGEMQRAAIARAIAPRPRTLLLDEPLTGLDPELHASILDLLRKVRAETGAAFVYVSHDHQEAEDITELVAVLRRGRLEYLGDWMGTRSVKGK
ncbi:MAG: ATP-binding cassette domain-containing protein [Dehalococcoidia bacterium]|nr:ATP-binding cassette domain-containing protein [Dehalococcoidia bacterium]